MNDEAAITNLYREMYSAMIRKDEAQLAQILHDDFVLVHMTGMHQAKNEYINAITDGVLNYYTEDTENVIISVSGDRAKLTGQSKVNAAVFGGGRHTWRLQLDIALVKNGDNWQMTRAEASTY
ncbi:MAG: nuclear transport factor 2 family protein [Synergistaceae bacterium]|nr:nuclear transport factor 2 family protein [Synergistaceae bacterium]